MISTEFRYNHWGNDSPQHQPPQTTHYHRENNASNEFAVSAASICFKGYLDKQKFSCLPAGNIDGHVAADSVVTQCVDNDEPSVGRASSCSLIGHYSKRRCRAATVANKCE